VQFEESVLWRYSICCSMVKIHVNTKWDCATAEMARLLHKSCKRPELNVHIILQFELHYTFKISENCTNVPTELTPVTIE